MSHGGHPLYALMHLLLSARAVSDYDKAFDVRFKIPVFDTVTSRKIDIFANFSYKHQGIRKYENCENGVVLASAFLRASI